MTAGFRRGLSDPRPCRHARATADITRLSETKTLSSDASWCCITAYAAAPVQASAQCSTILTRECSLQRSVQPFRSPPPNRPPFPSDLVHYLQTTVQFLQTLFHPSKPTPSFSVHRLPLQSTVYPFSPPSTPSVHRLPVQSTARSLRPPPARQSTPLSSSFPADRSAAPAAGR